MRIAILSISNKGQILAKTLKSKLDDDSTVLTVDCYHKNIKSIMKDAFENYDGIIAIMASGIIIRSIAPFIQSKSSDPAILCIDDNGEFVISLLSGHLGGANRLAVKVADLLAATAVITTSSDINNRLGIDTLARDLYFTIDDAKKILPINKAILEGRKVTFQVNKASDFSFLYDYLKSNTLEIDLLIEFGEDVDEDEIHVRVDGDILKLKKQKIVAGIGCRRGKSSHEIRNALENALESLNLSIKRVDGLASASIKKDEKGLLELSDELDIPIEFVELDRIEKFDFEGLNSSEFVKSKFGIKGVCEPAALISAGDSSKLIYKKTAFDGITVAVACEKIK